MPGCEKKTNKKTKKKTKKNKKKKGTKKKNNTHQKTKKKKKNKKIASLSSCLWLLRKEGRLTKDHQNNVKEDMATTRHQKYH